MFYDNRKDRSHSSVGNLRAEYENDLRAAIAAIGIERAVEETRVERDRLGSLVDGTSPDLTLAEAASIQALAPEAPGAETIVDLACDHLLLGMSNAILDVEALDRRLDVDLGAKTIQRKIERQESMTFDEFIRFQHAILQEQS
ncbi:MAG: hypothetical protein ACI9PP_000341 [Halobacteriales archaeon]|jgi:hypothetical protein